MNKKGKTYIILTVIATLSIIALEYTKPKEINWFPSYAKQHKVPFGTYIFREQLDRIFSPDNIQDINLSPYEFLLNKPDVKGTYVFINNQITFGKVELDELLEWTSQGNTLFIAANNFETELLEELNLETSIISTFNNFDNEYALKLKNTVFNEATYNFDKSNLMYFFSEIDMLNTSAVGIINNRSGDSNNLKTEHINIIKQPYGNGDIILSTFPQAFTNYFILSAPNNEYTANVTSYINDAKPIYLDSHYKSGKSFFSSPLYVLLNNKELKWAYYIMLIGVLIYVLFEGKRKQRAIPIVNPLKNQTLDYTRTIANMYYEKEQHKVLAQHKIQHFLEYIRLHLHLSTTDFDETFFANLSARSNNSIEATQQLFKLIELIQNKTQITHKELERLNALIEKFKSNNSWKTKT